MADLTVILLSVYNGAEFLREQLDSLERQADSRWTVVWRDDGSSDQSIAIMDAFTARVGPERVRRLVQPARRLGVAASFLALLRAAPAEATRFAFCDQDDVWLPEKLSVAAAALDAVPPGRPALHCTRQVLVNRELRRLGLSPAATRAPVLANALVQNIATGCTTVLNAAARRRMLSAPPPPPATLHDWWAYLVVTATGGEVLFDDTPTILYRQHGGNSVGAHASVLLRALRAIRRGPGPFLDGMAANVAALRACPDLTPQARQTLRALEPLHSAGPIGRLRASRRVGLRRQGFREDLLMRLWFVLRALPGAPPPALQAADADVVLVEPA